MNGLFTVGLTGQTGAGKSAVSALLRRAGFEVIDCDKVSREVTEKGKPALCALVRAFSPDILTEDGELNRRALGRIVFSDPTALALLNQIIFPYIVGRIEEMRADLKKKGGQLAVLDAPTLFESGADALCDYIIGVCADESLRKARIIARDGLTENEALSRIASQHTEAFFRARCHSIIENNDGEQELSEAVRRCVTHLLEVKNGRSHS